MNLTEAQPLAPAKSLANRVVLIVMFALGLAVTGNSLQVWILIVLGLTACTFAPARR